MEVKDIKLSLIQPPRLQPRLEQNQDGIRELATSIERLGLLSPLTVIEDNGEYRLLAGNRRYQALRLLDRTHAPCNIVTPDPALEDEMTIAENLIRLNLSPVEEAYAFAVHLERTGQSHTALADQLGKERTYVTRRLLLLDLDDTTLGALEEGLINLSQALLLRRIDQPEIRAKFIEHAVTYGANVRVMTMWVTNYEKEQARAKAENGRELQAADVTPPREVFMSCDRCGKPTSYDTLRPAYCCPSCKQIIVSYRALQAIEK